MAFEIIGPRLAGSVRGIGGSGSESGSSNIHAQVIHWLRLDKVGVWDTVSASNTSWQSCVSCCGSWILRLEVEPWPKAWPTLLTYHVWRKHVLMIGASLFCTERLAVSKRQLPSHWATCILGGDSPGPGPGESRYSWILEYRFSARLTVMYVIPIQ